MADVARDRLFQPQAASGIMRLRLDVTLETFPFGRRNQAVAPMAHKRFQMPEFAIKYSHLKYVLAAFSCGCAAGGSAGLASLRAA
jgi:hypothetical protein